jgi:hypothetical protein
VKEKAWARNYMQRPEAATVMTFPEALTEQMRDEYRSVILNPEPLWLPGEGRSLDDAKVPVIISLDPAIGGGNAILAAAMRPLVLDVLDCRLDFDLGSFADIYSRLEAMCQRWATLTSHPVELVIEDKAFQRGLLRDDPMRDLAKRYSLRIVPNTTGKEKNDPDIGVPQIPEAILRGEVTIPWADEPSRERMEPLLRHLHTWRQGVPGNKLEQDLVMTLWFAWKRWRNRLRVTSSNHRQDPDQWTGRASPLQHAHRPTRPRTHA